MTEIKLDTAYFEARRAELDTVFNYIKPDLKELAEYYLPRSVRFLVTDVNKKPAKNTKIKDSAPLNAVRNFSSGMMSGATNPATNWYRIKAKDFKLKDDYLVKNWCGQVEEIIRDVFNSSNFYAILTPIYKQLGVFGFAATALEKGSNTVMRTKLLPIGSYRYAKNDEGIVDTLCRHYKETAKNLYNRFGEDNVSPQVKNAVENKRYEELFEVVHFVCPNAKYMPDSPWAEHKKFLSVYYEVAGEKNKFLSKSGFNKFPYVVFEAEVNGEDVYPSDCPGINALPDVKQLMAEVVDKGKTIKKVITPTYKGPASLKNKKISDMPGVYIEEDENGRGMSPVYQIPPQVLVPIREDIADLRKSIGEIFYNDLFAMILNTSERVRTATEVNELKEEKMVLLSPILEQVHCALKIIIDWIFDTCYELGIIPEIPESIQGGELEIEFVSLLAQAQKATKISAMERFTTFTLNLAQSAQDPMLAKKLNLTKVINDYADYANINPEQLVDDKQIEELRKAQAEKQAQAEQMQQLQQGTEMIKNIGGVDAYGGELMQRLGVG